MKHFVTILFVLIAQLLTRQIVFGQTISDTCLTANQLYNLKYKIYYQSEINYIQSLQIRMLTELKRVDTLSYTKDSIVLNYISKTDSVLRTVKKYYNGDCLRDSLVIHFNKYGLTQYRENWAKSCNTDTTDKDIKAFTYKNSYSRYEYDKLRRITKYVFHISTPMTRRIIFTYDTEGRRTQQTIKISDTEFWD